MIQLSDARQALEAAGLIHGLSVQEVHARLETGLRLHDTGQRVLAFYLNEMEVGRLYQATGHGSTAYYAEVRLGLERRRTSELLGVGRKLLELPAIDHAFCTGAIVWSKVLLLASVATPEHEVAWLERARALTCRDLALEVRRARPGQAPRAPGDTKGLPEIRFRLNVSVPTLTHQKLELAKQKLSAESGHPVNDAECLDVLAELFLQLEQDGSIPGRTRVPASLYRIVLRHDGAEGDLVLDAEEGALPIARADMLRCDAQGVPVGDAQGAGGTETEASTAHGEHGERQSPHDLDGTTPAWMRQRVLARDGQRCRSCRSRWGLMVHHVEFRSHGGATQPSNLVTLCARCHGLVHDGLLLVVGEDAATATFLDARRQAVGAPAAPTHELPELTRPPAPAALDTLPEQIDAAWWRRHAHLLHMGPRGLVLEEGRALEAATAPEEPAASFDAAALDRAFDSIVGQDALRERFEVTARGSQARGKGFPHTILLGPPGTGKTTIAQALATSLSRRLLKASGPLLGDVHQLVRLLADLRQGDVLFLEEVHAVPRPLLEALYEALAEGSISLTLQAGAQARAVTFVLPAFTLVAATTEEGDLPAPFLARFGLREALAPYRREVLAEIVTRRATAQGFTLDAGAAARLAAFARATPREALRLLDRALDDAASRGALHVGEPAVAACLARLGYDEQGLAPLEQRYVATLRASPRPVPLKRLAALLGAAVSTLLRDVEPFLFGRGLIDVTPHGRIAALRPHLLEA